MSSNSIDYERAAVDAAVVSVARDWLLVCKNDFGEWPEVTSAELAALSPEEVISFVHQGWGGGLAAFLETCADDIEARREQALRDWYIEARRAARGRPFSSRIPTAALNWGRCTLTATEAVQELGVSIARDWLDGMSWREITDVLGVPTPIAALWAIDGVIRFATFTEE
ncbi:hypothetical protein [Nocardia sp. NPDC046763]|uniref:hypothetical protein n=1 Tax=Nocardia sp. NPDC046763 TaxID=3155256 RepID=UPI003409C33A